MPTAEQYRKSAEQCRRVADKAEDQIEREALRRIAAQWDRLAIGLFDYVVLSQRAGRPR